LKFTNKLKKEVFYELLIYLIVVLIVSVLWVNNVKTLIVLLIVWFLAILMWHDRSDIVIFIVAGIAGPLGEIVCINYGAWSYSNPSFLGIPFWLPLLWGFAGVMLTRIARTIGKILK